MVDELKNETTPPPPQPEEQGTVNEPTQANKMIAMLLNPKVIGGIVAVVLVLWLLSAIAGFFRKGTTVDVTSSRGIDMQTSPMSNKQQTSITITKKEEPPIVTLYPKPAQQDFQNPKPIMSYPAAPQQRQPEANNDTMKRTVSSVLGQSQGQRMKGIAFVNACISPLDNELRNRFWGWRVNDIIKWTDNVNNFQRGTLEVTRRTAYHLAQRISRTGSTAIIDDDLEKAMNWLMVKGDQLFLPSAESKYKEAVDNFKNYIKKLEKGEATIYTRAENLEPLLIAYNDLLGSCDENLVKTKEVNGKTVSFFKVDDYLYYSKGISSAMKVMMLAIREDFSDILVKMQAMEATDQAIVWLDRASSIEPLIVLDGSPGSIFANHRANMAAPISHARFHLEVVIKAVTAGRNS